MRKNLFVSSLMLVAATFLFGQPAFASENWVGSWKLMPRSRTSTRTPSSVPRR
jgi:hypothetical protein